MRLGSIFQHSTFKRNRQNGARGRGSRSLKALISLLLVIAIGGGVLALNTNPTGAQDAPAVQVLVAGDIVPVTVGDFDTAIFGVINAARVKRPGQH